MPQDLPDIYSTLVQVIAWCLTGTKPLPELMLTCVNLSVRVRPSITYFCEVFLKFKSFHFRKGILEPLPNTPFYSSFNVLNSTQIEFICMQWWKFMPVRGWQLWRQTRKFLLIFPQCYACDLRFKA